MLARHNNLLLAASNANLYLPGVFCMFADDMLSFSSVTFVLFYFVFVFLLSLKPRPFVSSFFDRTPPRNSGGMPQIKPTYGDERADAGRDCRNRLTRPNSQARTGTGRYLFSLFS